MICTENCIFISDRDLKVNLHFTPKQILTACPGNDFSTKRLAMHKSHTVYRDTKILEKRMGFQSKKWDTVKNCMGEIMTLKTVCEAQLVLKSFEPMKHKSHAVYRITRGDYEVRKKAA